PTNVLIAPVLARTGRLTVSPRNCLSGTFFSPTTVIPNPLAASGVRDLLFLFAANSLPSSNLLPADADRFRAPLRVTLYRRADSRACGHTDTLIEQHLFHRAEEQ